MLRALFNLLQAALYLTILVLPLGNMRKAHNRVHGRANIVAHVEKEGGLGLIGSLSLLRGLAQASNGLARAIKHQGNDH